MTPEKQIILMNNTGADYLLQKDYNEAIEFFRGSIKSTQDRLHQLQEKVSLDNDQTIIAQDQVTGLQFKFWNVGGAPFAASEGQEQDSTSGRLSASYIHKSAISVLACDRDLDICAGDRNINAAIALLSQVAIISMYNLALSHHMNGLEERCCRSLRRAVTYYELSLQLQAQQSINCLSYIHTMSALNNAATIFQLLNEPEHSAQFFQQLLTTMAYVREVGAMAKHRQPAFQHMSWWEGFWSNVSGVMLRNPCTAGAA